jgi:predicted nucleotidyltransferase
MSSSEITRFLGLANLTLARMQRELEALLGRKVGLVPKDGLKPIIREHILATARGLYAA